MVLSAFMGLWFSQHSWSYVSPRINEPVVLPAFMGLGFPNINGAYGFHSIDGPMVLTARDGDRGGSGYTLLIEYSNKVKSS